jgi:Zn-dependent protease
LLVAIALITPDGRMIVRGVVAGYMTSNSVLVPASLLLYELLVINVVLAIFNLIPVPPLDGSHVLRHFLSDSARRIYDTVGWLGLMALIYLGGGLLGHLIYPVLAVFNSILLRV